jgi:hypothetical protein
MKIIGFSINKVIAEKNSEAKGKIELASGLSMTNIAKPEATISGKDTIKFDFSFNIQYKPNLGKIELDGSVMVMDENNESKQIMEDWKKKKFDNPMKLPLFNFIMNKCNIRAIQLEDDLGLPPHFQLPKLTAQKDPESTQVSYTG